MRCGRARRMVFALAWLGGAAQAWAIATPKKAPAPASAPRVGDPVQEVGDLMTAGRYSEAIVAVRAALASAEDSAELRYDHGWLMLRVGDYPLSVAEAERAIELANEWADAWALLGAARQLLGEHDRAEQAVQRARELDPANEWAKELEAELALQRKIRGGEHPAHAPEGPTAAVHAFLVRANEPGGLAPALRALLDPVVLSKLPGGRRASAIDELVAGMQRSMNAQTMTYHGFLVEPETRTEGGAQVVRAHLLLTRRFSAEEIERMKRLYATPALQAYLDPDQLEVLAGLSPEDREQFYQRAAAREQLTPIELDLTLARSTNGPWRMTDLALVNSEGTGLTLSTFMENIGLFARASGAVGPRGLEKSPSTAYQLGRLIGVIIVLLGVAFVIDRLKRRRAP